MIWQSDLIHKTQLPQFLFSSDFLGTWAWLTLLSDENESPYLLQLKLEMPLLKWEGGPRLHPLSCSFLRLLAVLWPWNTVQEPLVYATPKIQQSGIWSTYQDAWLLPTGVWRTLFQAFFWIKIIHFTCQSGDPTLCKSVSEYDKHLLE